MAHSSAFKLTLLLSLGGLAGAALADETPAAESACAMGSGGADATGNDCGSVPRTEDYSRFHPVLAPRQRLLAQPLARSPAPTPAPAIVAIDQRQVNWPEGQTACATSSGGADPTGNDCNGQIVTTPIQTARAGRTR